MKSPRKSPPSYANFDLINGFWQLSLDKDSQESQYFITPDGVLTPTRVLRVTTNAVSHFQSAIQVKLPRTLKTNLLEWIGRPAPLRDLSYVSHERHPPNMRILPGFSSLCTS